MSNTNLNLSKPSSPNIKLQCDCALSWMVDWIQERFTETGEAKCSLPNSLAGKRLLDLRNGMTCYMACIGLQTL